MDSSSRGPRSGINISQFISVPLLVTTTDGRQFHGPLIATDNEQNIILSDATERLPIGFKSRRKEGFRYVGIIAIPGQYILRVDANKKALAVNTQGLSDELGITNFEIQ
ncbi:hypothetical protein V1512DRAFT_207650 [Lipomyces arxii]|uniref:uncharacterized protein n=1 Tax=Lipomyces arxii TaxID=56418 RepID=UPI0034CF48D7